MKIAAARLGGIGGLYQQQQESFRNLMAVLLAAILLTFVVLLIGFRSFNKPVAIVFGAILAMFGTVAALWTTPRLCFGRKLPGVSIRRSRRGVEFWRSPAAAHSRAPRAPT
jgi:hypothetical protein